MRCPKCKATKHEPTANFCHVCGFQMKVLIIENFDNYLITVKKGVSFRMIKVKGGRFQMGSSYFDWDAMSDEKPRHWVTLSDFCIGETVVTQKLWVTIMGNNPSYREWPEYPVENVSKDDCLSFISALNSLTGKQFRLPTEAEWEYAARGGNKSQGYKYSGSNNFDDVGSRSDSLYCVACHRPNELGIFDMSGGVYEFCQDKYEKYSKKEQYNSVQTIGKELSNVARGGCYYSTWDDCCVSRRHFQTGFPGKGLGFRLALSL